MISISIISPLKSMAVIDKAIEHNDFGCVFHRYVYENLEEIKDIYEHCKDISDVLFFSGELGYSYILTHVDDLKVPCTFISYTEKTLLSILLNFVIHYPDVPLNRLYIDFLTPVNDFMNLKKYLEYDRIFACGGSWMVKGKLIAEGRFDEIEKLTREAAEIVKNIRG